MATVDGLTLAPNRPPQAYITSPANDSQYEPNANVLLIGSAWDLEDGILADTNVAWYSSVDGFLGNGPVLNAQLSAGEHTIELRVIDSEGVTASDFVFVFVRS